MAIYRQRWMESVNDPNMGIYSVEQVLTIINTTKSISQLY